MATIFTPDDLLLLGYFDIEEEESTAEYAVINASLHSGLAPSRSRFIYLKSRCSAATARSLAVRNRPSFVKAYSRVFLLKPPKLGLDDDLLARHFGPPPKVFSELVWTALRRAFADYLKEAEANAESGEPFIPPHLGSTATGPTIVAVLEHYLSGRSHGDDGTLRVMLAGAGVGKTTLSRHLMGHLASRVDTTKTIPIYVEAEHWRSLNTAALHGLWDIINHSLYGPGASPDIKLTEALFSHALGQGYFCFIFDGFDELCGANAPHFDPSSVLRELSGWAKGSEARVLLTTRTLFWNAKISGVPPSTELMTLEPFNTQQARGYFTP